MNAEEEEQDSQGEEVGGVFQTEVWYVGAVDEVQASDEVASATRNPHGELGVDPEVGSAIARPQAGKGEASEDDSAIVRHRVVRDMV